MRKGQVEAYEKAGEMVLPFGMYCGMKIEDVPSGYLRWLRDDAENVPDDLLDAAALELEFRLKFGRTN